MWSGDPHAATECVTSLISATIPVQFVDDFANRVELQIGIFFPEHFDGIVRRHVLAAHRLECLSDLVIPYSLFTEEIVIVEYVVDVVADQALQRIGLAVVSPCLHGLAVSNLVLLAAASSGSDFRTIGGESLPSHDKSRSLRRPCKVN